MEIVCLIGYGRVGRATAHHLARHNIRPIVYDSSGRRVDEAKSEGFEAHLADSSNPRTALEIASTCDIIATALPSRVADSVLRMLISSGAKTIVDVSYIPDPLALREPALEHGVKLAVDAGFAPGLSNMLVARALEGLETVNRAIIYVGGLSASPSEPLGLVASWSMADMLEEYSRPARARIDGRPVKLSPIDDATIVEIPGVGGFDALPTDGLRTLLQSFPEARTMIEYTLRYRGHVALVKTLRQLGLLEDKPLVIGGCSVSPREMIAKTLEERLPKSGDRVILHVVVEGVVSDKRITRSYTMDVTQERLGIRMPVLTYLTGLVHAWFVKQFLRGSGHPGLNAPEEFADKLGELLAELRASGIYIERRECVEEFE